MVGIYCVLDLFIVYRLTGFPRNFSEAMLGSGSDVVYWGLVGGRESGWVASLLAKLLR